MGRIRNAQSVNFDFDLLNKMLEHDLEFISIRDGHHGVELEIWESPDWRLTDVSMPVASNITMNP